jgi:hypothetical protein
VRSVAEGVAALDDEQLPTDVVAFEDREQDRAPALVAEPREALEEAAHPTFSRNTSISPPHGRPTLQAWSSEMP